MKYTGSNETWSVPTLLSNTRTLVVGEKSSQPGYYKDKSTVEIVLSATQTHRAPAH